MLDGRTCDRLKRRVSVGGEIAWERMWGSSLCTPPSCSLSPQPLLTKPCSLNYCKYARCFRLSPMWGSGINVLFFSVCVCVSVAMHQALDTLSDSTSSTTANDLDLIFLKGIMESPVVRRALCIVRFVSHAIKVIASFSLNWTRRPANGSPNENQIIITSPQHRVRCKIKHIGSRLQQSLFTAFCTLL